MKVKYLPLVIGLLAAAASITGIAFTQWGSVRLEGQKWELTQAESKRKSLNDAVIDYARDLGAAIQNAELITWAASNDPESIKLESFRAYE